MHIHTCSNYHERRGIQVGFYSTVFHVDKAGHREHQERPAVTQRSAVEQLVRRTSPGTQLPNSES